jgi:hypothetical protein
MDGYQNPLAFHNGLLYLKCRPPTSEEVDYLPHVIMTSDINWDSTTYNNDKTDIMAFYNASIYVTCRTCVFDEHEYTDYLDEEPEFFRESPMHNQGCHESCS